jgi:GNAT superfamily N-acetyltransferase
MPSELRDVAAATFRVRPAAAADAEFVIELADRFGPARASWRSCAEVVDGTRRQLRAAFDECRDGDALLVVTDAGGERLGFAYVVTHHDFFTGEAHGHLSEIATRADGSGAGTALLEAAESWCRERGFRYLSLNVNDSNERARVFYERRAFIAEYRHLVKLL